MRVELEDIIAGSADLAVAEGFFTEKGQARDGLGCASGQFQPGLEGVLVEVPSQAGHENRAGEPSFEGVVTDAEVAEGVGDVLAGFEDVKEEGILFFREAFAGAVGLTIFDGRLTIWVHFKLLSFEPRMDANQR